MVPLNREDTPVLPSSAAAISGRSRWFSMTAGSCSESASTTPRGSMTVIRTLPSAAMSRARLSSAGLRPPARSGATATLAVSAALVSPRVRAWKATCRKSAIV